MITGVILAHNEEQHIAECIESLQSYVEEVILIDTESTDKTREIAEPLVDRVISHPNRANFDSLRNLAIDVAAHDWLWYVDADERISKATGTAVRQMIREQGGEFEAILIPFKSYFCGQWMQHCGWWPGYTMPRVLKRGHFHFAERLHGGVNLDGRQVRFPPDPATAIEHFSYANIEHYLKKLNRYTSTEANQLAEQGATYDWRIAVWQMIGDLWNYYEKNEGFRDGEKGWVLSWLSGQYRWLSHTKILDLTPSRVDSKSLPRDLDEVIDFMEATLSQLRAGHPQLPLSVIWRSPIWDPSGYADESRTFVKALYTGERPLVLRDIHWASQECELPPADRGLFRALSGARYPRHSMMITNCIPGVAGVSPLSSLNILRTTNETDRIPAAWFEHLAAYDEVWVISQHNYRAFVRSGVPPEKLRVVPSCVDTELFTPNGQPLDLPPEMAGRFVYLSIFDWGYRKGWDLLLSAYATAFSIDDGTGLLLKITRNHGHPLELVKEQVDVALRSVGQNWVDRPDIVLWDKNLSGQQVAELYRSVNAFVLPSRGEGWGRPYMEAMATRLPTIGTAASGNMDFMNAENSFLVAAREVDVPPEAVKEVLPYNGHRWHEPDYAELVSQIRLVFADREESLRRANRGFETVTQSFSLDAGREAMENAMKQAEDLLRLPEVPKERPNQIRVEIEGELGAGHSFSKVNAALLGEWVKDKQSSFALSLRRVFHNPTPPAASYGLQQLLPYAQRQFDQPPQVTIRHAFPPNWIRPESGKWVHIQPFEYGHLPVDWIPPLRDEVDEIWVPSEYVRRLYQRSGIPDRKIRVIPWGIDPVNYRSDAISLILPTRKTFRFLFVGGMIARKGFDRALQAYREEFHCRDDVVFVVKGLGEDTFYRYGNFRETLHDAISDAAGPEIVYLDQMLTEAQLPSLYTACHCLVAPYRGEGFGLHILEAMACGLPAIVPKGGATDDFVSGETAFLVDAAETTSSHSWELSGPCLELEMSIVDIRRQMREAFERREITRAKGARAAHEIRSNWTWRHTIERMTERIIHLVGNKPKRNSEFPATAPPQTIGDSSKHSLAIGVLTRNNELGLPGCLSRLLPLHADVVVLNQGKSDRSVAVANEYGVRAIQVPAKAKTPEIQSQLRKHTNSTWVAIIRPDDLLPHNVAQSVKQTLCAAPASKQSVTVEFVPDTMIAKTRGAAKRRLRFDRVR